MPLSFFKHVLKSGLLEGEILEKIFKETRTKLRKADSHSLSLPAFKKTENKRWKPFDYAFAEELVGRGLLNSWQVSQLLSGRVRFSLGEYRILDSLGQGGYGMVFLAKHAVFERTLLLEGEQQPLFAVKVLPANKATPELIERFHHEIEIQRNLFHPNLVRFLDSGFDGSVHYMVHEYIDGGNLRKWIRSEEKIPLHHAAKIISEITDALEYLHSRKIVHRDVKPSNILLNREGHAKLADFGLAVHIRPKISAEEDSLVSESIQEIERERQGIHLPSSPEGGLQRKVAGTADYLAPDQIRNPHHPNGLWDIYSLGCTFYHLMAGIVPFPMGTAHQKILAHLQQEPPDVRTFCESLPNEIALLISEMMARQPQERIQSLREISERLASWANPILVPEEPDSLGSFQLPNDPSPLVEAGMEFTFVHFPSTGDVLRIQVPPVIERKFETPLENDQEDVEELKWGIFVPMLLIVFILILGIALNLK